MLRTSREIIRRLEREGWVRTGGKGSHTKYENPRDGRTVVVPHPRKDLGTGLARTIYRQAGWTLD